MVSRRRRSQVAEARVVSRRRRGQVARRRPRVRPVGLVLVTCKLQVQIRAGLFSLERRVSPAG